MLNKSRRMFLNITILTGTSLLIRLIAFSFQVWLVEQVGSEGIGLFGLVMSVSAFASTLAISGVSYAAVRLVSEEIGAGRHGSVGRTVWRCTVYALFFGTLASGLVLAGSEKIAFLALGDTRAAAPMRLLAVTLPLISVLTVFQGYFTAVGRVYKNAAVHLAEQIARVIIIALLVKNMPKGDIEYACTLIIAGGAASEILSFIIMLTLYIFDRVKHGVKGCTKIKPRIIKTAMPVAIISYTKTALSMLQNLLIPHGLMAAGYAKDAALSGYGIIQGMVMPIIYFPTCVLFSTAELIVPDMTEAQVTGDFGYISRVSSSLIRKCLIYAVAVAAMTYIFANDLSLALYGTGESAPFIRVFAVIIPVMYLNMMADGLLRGLGQQTYVMVYSIVTAVLSTVAIKLFLPVYALTGYVMIFTMTECAMFAFGFIRLGKLAGIRITAGEIFIPILCSTGAFSFTRLVIGNVIRQPVCALVLGAALGAALYAGLIFVINTTKPRMAFS